MKKFITAIICVLIAIICALPMVGCSDVKPETDLAVAKANLEEAGYEVMHKVVTDLDDLVEFAGVKEVIYGDKFDEDGNIISNIGIYVFEDEKLAKTYLKEYEVCYEKLVISDKSVVEFYDMFLEKYKDDMSPAKKAELEEERAEYNHYISLYENAIVGRSGKIVWAGDIDAINATKNG